MKSRKPNRVRRWPKWLIGAVAVIVLIIVIGPRAVGALLRGRLQQMVASHLNARLEAGSAVYLPPYGIRLHDAALIFNDPGGPPVELLRVKQAELKLAELPVRSRPLVIESITLHQPALHLLKTESGMVGRHGLIISNATTQAGVHKASEMFRLRRLEITGGEVVYDHRAPPQVPPMVWRNLNVNVDTTPQSASGYDYQLSARDAPLLELASSGTFDIDTLELHAQKLTVVARADSSKGIEALPPRVQELLTKCEVAGQLRIDGSAQLSGQKDQHATFAATIQLRDGHFRLPRCDVNEVQLDGMMERRAIMITRLRGKTLGGTVAARGRILLDKPLSYEGGTSLKNIDMAQVGAAFAKPGGKPLKLTGRGFADVDFHGEGKSLDGLEGEGEAEVLDGDFWDAPVLADIPKQIGVDREALTAGQGAATFEIKNRQVILSKAAATGSVVGLQGSGTLGFDGQLDLRVIAAPLAKWKENMTKTGIPIVSRVVGEVVGAIEKLLNTATSNLLYEFKVSGTASQPQITPVPVPLLGHDVAQIFAAMLAPNEGDHLLNAVREKPNVKKIED